MLKTKSPFVVVHGAWTGAWSWQKVVRLIQAAGHEIHVPTLSGLAERSHLADLDINLSTHIKDIQNEIFFKDLQNVTLVCHSYGGFVGTGVIEKIQERIGAVIYLDAFIPKDGTSFSDLNPKWNEKGPLVQPPKMEESETTTKADLEWMKPRVTAQPIGTMTEKIHVTGAFDEIAKKTFIVNTGWDGPFAQIAKPLRTDSSWRVVELESGHDAPMEKPKELAGLLIECAAPPATSKNVHA